MFCIYRCILLSHPKIHSIPTILSTYEPRIVCDHCRYWVFDFCNSQSLCAFVLLRNWMRAAAMVFFISSNGFGTKFAIDQTISSYFTNKLGFSIRVRIKWQWRRLVRSISKEGFIKKQTTWHMNISNNIDNEGN